MMNMLQNQARTALPNVLHDQGIANTIGGIAIPIAPRPRFTVHMAAFVTAVAGLLGLLAFLIGRGA